CSSDLIAVAIPLAAMRSDGGLENGNWDDLCFARAFLPAPASGGGQFHLILWGRRKLFPLALGQQGHDVATLEPRTSPVKPAVLFASQFAELDVITRGGGKLSV